MWVTRTRQHPRRILITLWNLTVNGQIVGAHLTAPKLTTGPIRMFSETRTLYLHSPYLVLDLTCPGIIWYAICVILFFNVYSPSLFTNYYYYLCITTCFIIIILLWSYGHQVVSRIENWENMWSGVNIFRKMYNFRMRPNIIIILNHVLYFNILEK